MIFNYKRYK